MGKRIIRRWIIAIKFKVDKPIRLIELFAGYGSQALALKYFGVPFEHHRISEWALKSIQAYKDLHFSRDDTDYSQGKTTEEIRAWLYGRISSDYNTPMSNERVNCLRENRLRTIYNNMRATHNLGSICKMTGDDLAITDTDKYCYIMTYSFPCQDLSVAGKGAGMAKESGTRSGLLWEVVRLLSECGSLPQILIMENVPQVLSTKNRPHFERLKSTLKDLGYSSEVGVLNAKDYGVPQNRKRCFMVSVPQGSVYAFPKATGCELRLKDVLEDDVDEKYYLTENVLRVKEK